MRFVFGQGDVEPQLDPGGALARALPSGRYRSPAPRGSGRSTQASCALIVRGRFCRAPAASSEYSRGLDADCARLMGEPPRGPGQESVWRVWSGLSAACGGVAKATQLPLGVEVRYSSRAELGPWFCASCGSALGLRLGTALPAGLGPPRCEAARAPGRRLAERPRAAHPPSSHFELRGRAVPSARRQLTAAPGDRLVRNGAPSRADRAITRRRGRRPRAWGEACGPRTPQSRPILTRTLAAA